LIFFVGVLEGGMPQERVQKILAQAGIASRRKAEELILEGVVTINGRVAQLGDKAELGTDSIKVRGKQIAGAESPVYLAFYKPRGVISALADPEGRVTIAGYLGRVKARVFPIGRLDFNSEGLLLLTNDGAFAQTLSKRDDVPRVYQVKVRGHIDPAGVTRLEKGTRIEGREVRPHSVRLARELAKKSSVEVVMIGPGATDLKALFEMKGFLVEKITRTAIGHITLRGLQPGAYRQLTKSQVEALLSQPELGMRLIDQASRERPEGIAPSSIGQAGNERSARRARVARAEGAAAKITPVGEGARGPRKFGKPGAGKPKFGKPAFGKAAFGGRGGAKPGGGFRTRDGRPDRPAKFDGRPDRPTKFNDRPGRPTRSEERPGRPARSPGPSRHDRRGPRTPSLGGGFGGGFGSTSGSRDERRGPRAPAFGSRGGKPSGPRPSGPRGGARSGERRPTGRGGRPGPRR
jgi:23S rRNA pseudouridine2605 synthase